MTKQLTITQEHVDKARTLLREGGSICQHCPTSIAFCEQEGHKLGTIWTNNELIHGWGVHDVCIKYGVPSFDLARQIDNFTGGNDYPFQPGVYDYEDVSTPA